MLQNKNGGLSAWETTKGAAWLEVRVLNQFKFQIKTRIHDHKNKKQEEKFIFILLAKFFSHLCFCFSQLLNPTEFLADIVVEYEYVECTATAIQALVLFMKLYPGHRKKEIEAFIVNALRYLEDSQLPDGSW